MTQTQSATKLISAAARGGVATIRLQEPQCQSQLDIHQDEVGLMIGCSSECNSAPSKVFVARPDDVETEIDAWLAEHSNADVLLSTAERLRIMMAAKFIAVENPAPETLHQIPR